MPIQTVEFSIHGKLVHMVRGLPDRRPAPAGVDRSAHTRWFNQAQLEYLLYDNSTPTGAMNKLLKRTPIDANVPPNLVLRSKGKAIESGLVTEEEWAVLERTVHTGTRTQTLVPKAAVVACLGVIGRNSQSMALLTTLGEGIPASWRVASGGAAASSAARHQAAQASENEAEDDEEGEEEAGEEEESGDEEEEGEEEDEGGEEEEDGEEEDDGTDEFSYHSAEDDEGEGGGGAVAGSGDNNDNSDDDDENGNGGGESSDGAALQQQKKKVKRGSSCYTLKEIPDALERELAAMALWRSEPVNRHRSTARVEATTIVGERADVLRLLGWLHTRNVHSTSLVAIFGSQRLGAVVETFVKSLVSSGRLYSTCASYVASYIAAARFSYSVRQRGGQSPSTAPIDALVTLHRQCKQQAAQQELYSRKQEGRWLTWEQCQRAKVAAVEAYAAAKSEKDSRKLLLRARDALLLTWLTHQPPDRVGVARLLQYGTTLVPGANGEFALDLSQPGAHKTV